jgi:hypothetical protein
VARRDLLMSSFLVLHIPIEVAVFKFNTGIFGNEQLIGGVTAIFVNFVYLVFLLAAAAAIAWRAATVGGGIEKHAFSGLVRWRDLVLEQGQLKGVGDVADLDATTSILLIHDPKSPSTCPCPLNSCAGGLPNRTTWLAVLTSVVLVCLNFLFLGGSTWTPTITFSSAFWGTWWSALSGTLYALLLFCNALVTLVIWSQIVNPAVLDLSFRLHHRAVKLALGSLVEHSKFDLFHGTTHSSDELYLSLHHILSAIWRNRLESQMSWRRLFFWSSTLDMIVLTIIYVVREQFVSTLFGC